MEGNGVKCGEMEGNGGDMHRISQSSLFFTAPISPPGFPEGAGASHDRLPEHATSKCPERTNGGKVKHPEVPAGWGTQEL